MFDMATSDQPVVAPSLGPTVGVFNPSHKTTNTRNIGWDHDS